MPSSPECICPSDLLAQGKHFSNCPTLIAEVEAVEADLINSPPHYTHGPIEVIDLIELFDLDYNEGNALKYLLRWKLKGGVQDLRKAIWYLERTIKVAEDGPGSTAPRGLKEELSRSRGQRGEDHWTTGLVDPRGSDLSGTELDKAMEEARRDECGGT